MIDVVKWATGGDFTGKDGFKLFDDAGQIYELQLAKMEYTALRDNLLLFRKRTAYFEKVKGENSYHCYIASVRGKGQIGTSNQYMTHWFYPYKGKFHGQMVKAIVNFMVGPKGGKILDPFLGSGTTTLETSLLGVEGFGVELNPALAWVAYVKARMLNVDYKELHKEINAADPLKILDYFVKAKPRDLLTFPLNTPAGEVSKVLWQERFRNFPFSDFPEDYKNFLLLAFLHALSDYTYLKNTSKAKTLREFFIQDLGEYLFTLRETRRVLEFLDLIPKIPNIIVGDARSLPFDDSTFDGVVTSPPYSIAIDYLRNDRHLIDYLGLKSEPLKERMIGLRGGKASKLALYEEDMRRSIEEIARVLKPGAWAAIVLGDVVVNGKRTDYCIKIAEWAPDLGFDQVELIRRPILGGFARLRYEYIIMLQKAGGHEKRHP